MLHNVKRTVPTPVNTVLQLFTRGVSPDQKDYQGTRFLVPEDAGATETKKSKLVKAKLASEFEWFEYNEGCLK
jgi:hypothetical protein